MKPSCTFLFLASLFFLQCSGGLKQPEIETRNAGIVNDGKYSFRDLNKNGKLDPYEDWRLPTQERISNLVSLMTLEEKTGLMFHPNIAITPDGTIKYDLTQEEKETLAAEGKEFGSRGFLPGQVKPAATAKSYIEEKHFRCILNNGTADPQTFATWSNGMQEIAESSRLGIPIMFSSDPRHGAVLQSHITGMQMFSQWPGAEGQVGMTATRNPGLMKKYGEVTAEEYRAVGLHMILGPQIDLITEPRWRRSFGSFSESAELTSEMLEAFMEGAQGASAGPGKILVQLKHWPGQGLIKEEPATGLYIPATISITI
jgi:beta-glucosidase